MDASEPSPTSGVVMDDWSSSQNTTNNQTSPSAPPSPSSEGLNAGETFGVVLAVLLLLGVLVAICVVLLWKFYPNSSLTRKTKDVLPKAVTTADCCSVSNCTSVLSTCDFPGTSRPEPSRSRLYRSKEWLNSSERLAKPGIMHQNRKMNMDNRQSGAEIIRNIREAKSNPDLMEDFDTVPRKLSGVTIVRTPDEAIRQAQGIAEEDEEEEGDTYEAMDSDGSEDSYEEIPENLKNVSTNETSNEEVADNEAPPTIDQNPPDQPLADEDRPEDGPEATHEVAAGDAAGDAARGGAADMDDQYSGLSEVNRCDPSEATYDSLKF